VKSVTHNLMSDFVAMEAVGYGKVIDLVSLIRDLCQDPSVLNRMVTLTNVRLFETYLLHSCSVNLLVIYQIRLDP
jgi:hypothetical protein